ncbi:MAG: mannonate dehydratase [Treponema sp.]|jgi:mannonate dehydratase|nr:mannonate dehydratase [Treponema sp.]
MQMTIRWFGKGFDAVTLEQIRQIPRVKGVITTLYGTLPGEVWEKEAIAALKKEVEDAGLCIAGIESVNIHDAIKTGAPERDAYIDNYITTLERLGQAGIHLVCYNFMPVFDWTRTDLAKKLPDGSTTMAYDQKIIDTIDPNDMSSLIERQSNGFTLAGWEPERLGKLKELFALYNGVTEETLVANLKYFLEAIMPVCEKYDIKMAIHPDDPGWSVFGLPRIMKNRDDLVRLITMVKNPCNGVTLCTGSLGTNPKNDIPSIIPALKGRIHFAHLRNVLHTGEGTFEESAHPTSYGSLDMFAIVKALYDTGFDGPMRPDHGRAIWGEKGMPGYGLYDRALGAAYLNGLWEAIERLRGGK